MEVADPRRPQNHHQTEAGRFLRPWPMDHCPSSAMGPAGWSCSSSRNLLHRGFQHRRVPLRRRRHLMGRSWSSSWPFLSCQTLCAAELPGLAIRQPTSAQPSEVCGLPAVVHSRRWRSKRDLESKAPTALYRGRSPTLLVGTSSSCDPSQTSAPCDCHCSASRAGGAKDAKSTLSGVPPHQNHPRVEVAAHRPR